jgi:uncharacterized protein YkvS
MVQELFQEELKQERKPVKKAKVGDMIEFKQGKRKGRKAKVIIVRENSVIVEIGKNPNTGEPIRTVVNHRNYKKVK